MIAKYFKVVLILSLVSFSVMGQTFINGNGNGSSCCGDFVIQVNGEGKVQVKPDVAILKIGVEVTEKTSLLATNNAATKIKQVNKILTANQIKSSDVQTTYLSVFP
jgi:uncharacterized protein YggE